MDYEDIKSILDARKQEETKDRLKYNKVLQENARQDIETENIYSRLNEAYLEENDYEVAEFRDKVKSAYLVEALTIFVDNCLSPELVREEYNQKLVRQLATNLVKEEGADHLLLKFRRGSYLLSEFAYLCDKHTEIALTEAKKAKDESKIGVLKLHKSDKDNYLKDLQKTNVDNSITKIAQNVKQQVQDFVQNNAEDKAKITQAFTKAQDKVSEEKAKLAEKVVSPKSMETSQAKQEGYIEYANRRAVDMVESRSKSVFECMVRNMAKTALVNESAQEVFMKDSHLDMQKLVEHCEVLYTFVSAMHGIKVINVDEAYIEDMLQSMTEDSKDGKEDRKSDKSIKKNANKNDNKKELKVSDYDKHDSMARTITKGTLRGAAVGGLTGGAIGAGVGAAAGAPIGTASGIVHGVGHSISNLADKVTSNFKK